MHLSLQQLPTRSASQDPTHDLSLSIIYSRSLSLTLASCFISFPNSRSLFPLSFSVSLWCSLYHPSPGEDARAHEGQCGFCFVALTSASV